MGSDTPRLLGTARVHTCKGLLTAGKIVRVTVAILRYRKIFYVIVKTMPTRALSQIHELIFE